MAVFKVRRYKNDDFPSAVVDGDFLISKSTGHASFDIKSIRVPLRGRNQELSDFQSSAVQKSTDFPYGVRYKFTSSTSSDVPSDDKALTEAAAAKRFTYAASGISSSTPITSYGWKRVAILSRKMSGTVGLCFESNKAQAGVVRHNVLISYQGVTDYPTADANAHAKRYPGKNEPNVTIISNKVSGENQDIVMPCRRIRIQAVRIAYPSYSKADSDAGKYPSSSSGPVACYLDVFVGSGDFDAVMPSGGIASSALSVNLMGDTLTSVDGDQFALLTDKEYNATDVGIKGEALNLDSVYLVLDRYNSLDSTGSAYQNEIYSNKGFIDALYGRSNFKIKSNELHSDMQTQRFTKISSIVAQIYCDPFSEITAHSVQVGLIKNNNLLCYSTNQPNYSSDSDEGVQFFEKFDIDIDDGTFKCVESFTTTKAFQLYFYDSRGLVRTTTNWYSTAFDCPLIMLKGGRKYYIQDMSLVVMPLAQFYDFVSNKSDFLSKANSPGSVPGSVTITGYNTTTFDRDAQEYTPNEDMVVIRSSVIVGTGKTFPKDRELVPILSDYQALHTSSKVGFSSGVRIPIERTIHDQESSIESANIQISSLGPNQSKIGFSSAFSTESFDFADLSGQINRLVSKANNGFHSVTMFVDFDTDSTGSGRILGQPDATCTCSLYQNILSTFTDNTSSELPEGMIASQPLLDTLIYSKYYPDYLASPFYSIDSVKSLHFNLDLHASGLPSGTDISTYIRSLNTSTNINKLIKSSSVTDFYGYSQADPIFKFSFVSNGKKVSYEKLTDGTSSQASAATVGTSNTFGTDFTSNLFMPFVLRAGVTYSLFDCQIRHVNSEAWYTLMNGTFNWSSIESPGITSLTSMFSGICDVASSGRQFTWTDVHSDPTVLNRVKLYTPPEDRYVLVSRINISSGANSQDIETAIAARYDSNGNPCQAVCPFVGEGTWEPEQIFDHFNDNSFTMHTTDEVVTAKLVDRVSGSASDTDHFDDFDLNIRYHAIFGVSYFLMNNTTINTVNVIKNGRYDAFVLQPKGLSGGGLLSDMNMTLLLDMTKYSNSL